LRKHILNIIAARVKKIQTTAKVKKMLPMNEVINRKVITKRMEH